ncbi:MAG: winged helix-turn-helix transcriptional regulator [bacterium]|nr:winged helix-turn-helix transcriptional regulator [bacterium]
MDEKTSEKIITYIRDKGQASGNDLAHFLGITTRAVRKQLAKLLEENVVYKRGTPPKVYYFIDDSQKDFGHEIVFDKKTKKIIEANFLMISPSGERKEGVLGFIEWCKKRNEDIVKTAHDYVKSYEKFNKYKVNGLIDGKYKIKNTFKEVFLDKVFYLDFYSIERFGKTKLGQILLYAKQSQNKDLISELVTEIKPKIEKLIEELSIDAVGFIPPTVKREVQLMRELERLLNLSIPSIALVKIKTEITIPQKTLTKLEDRIENARHTILVDDNRTYKTILLIDDALGSGSTLNETAKKIKDRKLSKNVIGLAITGSFSGFEVISEV